MSPTLWKFAWTVFFFVLGAHSLSAPREVAFKDPHIVLHSWNVLEAEFTAMARSGNPQDLYNLGEFTYPTLRATLEVLSTLPRNTTSAAVSKTLIDHMCIVFSTAADGLVPVTHYSVAMGGSRVNYTFANPIPMWIWPSTHGETILDSAQFVYNIARMIHHIATVSEDDRSPAQWTLLTRLADVIVNDHLMRWIAGPPAFEVHAWGCGHNDTPLNHTGLLFGKLHRQFVPGPAYCNAVRDVDMWIWSSALEIRAAFDADPQVIPLRGRHVLATLDTYLKIGAAAVASRVQRTPPREGAPLGFLFDVGVWDQHPDWAYASYTPLTPFPTAKSPAVNGTWDVSHGRRFVAVLNSADRLGAKYAQMPPAPTGSGAVAFNNARTPRAVRHVSLDRSSAPNTYSSLLATQWGDVVWNQNCTHPEFSNYFNGDGWFRVGYHDHGFGYGPGDDGCATAMTGGFGLLSQFSATVEAANECVWALLTSTDASAIAWKKARYQTHWNAFKRQPAHWRRGSIDSDLLFLQLSSTRVTFT